jgi:hypothetical protein
MVLRSVGWLSPDCMLLYVFVFLRCYATSQKVECSIPDEVIAFFSIYLIHPAAKYPWGRFSLEQNRVSEIFLGGKGRPACRADNVMAICEQIV